MFCAMEPLVEAETVELRHAKIADDEVVALVPEAVQGDGPVRRHRDPVALDGKEIAQDRCDLRLVVDDEDRQGLERTRRVRRAPWGGYLRGRRGGKLDGEHGAGAWLAPHRDPP